MNSTNETSSFVCFLTLCGFVLYYLSLCSFFLQFLFCKHVQLSRVINAYLLTHGQLVIIIIIILIHRRMFDFITLVVTVDVHCAINILFVQCPCSISCDSIALIFTCIIIIRIVSILVILFSSWSLTPFIASDKCRMVPSGCRSSDQVN